MKNFDFSSYLSPFTWRYGSDEMRKIFSEKEKYKTWRKIWVALAKAQKEVGLVSEKELADLKKYQDNIDIARILEIEKETKHDVVSAIREFSEKAKIGGGKIHLGATSQDIGDNADMIRNKKALVLIENKILKNLSLFAKKIDMYKDTVCMAYTHLQPAEPTTLGYRFAYYAQDLLIDLELLSFVKKIIKGKGFKGAVGTSASYVTLIKEKKIAAKVLEERVLKSLELEAVDIATQVYPRKFDFLLLTFLSSIASSASKFAFDLRIMQSSGFGEWQEPFGHGQVGSSAMPFKRNPLTSEKICSLARFVASLPPIVLENASNSLLERTLDDSSNKRVVIPEAFLAVDEILSSLEKIISGLIVHEKKISFNVSQYAPFSATELILIEAVKKGANRQEMHEALRKISMTAWSEIQDGKENPMEQLLISNSTIRKYLDENQIKKSFYVHDHIGDAEKRAKELAKLIHALVQKESHKNT